MVIKKDEQYVDYSWYRWSESEGLNKVTQALLDDYIKPYLHVEMEVHPQEKNLQSCCKVLMINIWYALGEQKPLKLSLNKNRWTLHAKYNKTGVGYENTRRIVDALVALDFLDMTAGFYDKAASGYGGYSKETRLFVKQKMEDLFSSHGVFDLDVTSHPERQSIELKAAKDNKGVKKLVSYADDNMVKKMRELLTEYNNKLKDSDLSMDSEGGDYIDFSDRFVKRVFNNKSWKQGGRFYGGWWQGINSGLRREILIDGENVVELDFTAMHLHMLYALDGKVCDLNDPYALPSVLGERDEKKFRKLMKKYLLYSLNSSNKKQAMQGLRKEVMDNANQYPEDKEKREGCFREFDALHSKIKQCFYCGKGMELQNLDSKIAEGVINDFLRMDEVVLCVHDSFLCKYSLEKELLDSMKRHYREVMKVDIVPLIR